jgi:uncharacterized protein YjbJ (UPF0337 family)
MSFSVVRRHACFPRSCVVARELQRPCQPERAGEVGSRFGDSGASDLNQRARTRVSGRFWLARRLQSLPLRRERRHAPYIEENTMNWDKISGEWRELQGKFRAKWGKLTDDDLETISGKKDQLIGRLQQRYGYQKDHAEREVDDFLKTI